MIMPQSIPEKGTFKPQEIAVLFGVSRKTVYKWVQAGRIHCIQMVRAIRFPYESVIDFINRNGEGYVLENKKTIRQRLTGNMRSRINRILTGKMKAASTMSLVGCTAEELKAYIEKQFKPGMTWENYGLKGWHIDHIIPCAQFDLSRPYHQRICFHYSNLQPMWSTDNIKKGKRVSRINVAKYFINFRKTS